MYTRERAIHLVSLFAILVSMFSGVLNQPVLAESATPDPEVTLATEDDGSLSSGQEETDTGDADPVVGPTEQGETPVQDEPPAAAELMPVAPAAPIISEVACEEGAVYSHTASAPATDGVTYEIGAPDADGQFTVTATLTDASVYTWADSGLEDWTVSGNQAEMTGTVSLCPVESSPEDEAEEIVPDEETTDDAQDESQNAVEVPVANGLVYIEPGQTRASSQVGTTSTDTTLNYSISPTTPVAPGTLVAFSASVHTTVRSHDVGMVSELPAGVTFSHFSVESINTEGVKRPTDPVLYACAFDEGIATCGLSSGVELNAGATIIWTVHATVDTLVPGSTCQLVRPSSVQGSWEGSPTLSADLTVACTMLLNLTATDDIADGESVGLHEPFTYTVTLTNTGSVTDGEFRILSQLPQGVILTGDSPITHPAGTTCTPGVGGSVDPVTINCSGTSVPSGEGNGLVFQFTVMAVDILENQVILAGCGEVMFAAAGILGEWNQDARLVNVYTDLDCVSSVDYTLEPLQTPVEPGGTIGFVQTVRNTGNTHIITLGMFNAPPPDLPAGAEWSGSFEIDGVTYDSLPSIGALKPGSVFKATYQSSPIPTDLTLPAPEWCTQFTFSNDVEFMFTTQERVEDSGSATVRVNCAGVSIEQQVSDATIQPGGEVTYTISVTNLGNTTVSPVYVFHDSSETGSVFSNWQVTSENQLDCGLVEDVDPGCTYVKLDPDETVEITITGDAPLDPNAEQCEPVTSRAVFIYGEAMPAARATANPAQPYTPVYSDPVTTQLNCVSSFTFSNEPLESPVVPGEPIGFELTVHNNGTVRMTDLSVSPEELAELPEGDWNVSFELNGVPIEQGDFRGLDAGETLVITVVSDAIPGDLTVPNNEWCKPWNTTFTATADFSNGSELTTTDSATVEVNCTGLTIDLEVNAPAITPGEKVVYTATVTNHGNAAVAPVFMAMDLAEPSTVFTNFTVSSDFEGIYECEVLPVEDAQIAACLLEGLLPQESVTVTVTGDAPDLPTLAQCDVVENQAMFLFGPEGQVPEQPVPQLMSVPITPPGIPILSEYVTTQIDCQPEVDISLDSEIDFGDNDRVDAGDTVTYTLVVTNSGNMALYDIAVTSDMTGIEWDRELDIDELLPEGSVTITGTYVITQDDIDTGEVVNTASVTASLEAETDDPGPVTLLGFAQTQDVPTTISASATETTQIVQEPGIDLMMSSDASGDLSLGETVNYTFTVTNTGNVTLTNLELIGDGEGLEFGTEPVIEALAPGESAELVATYIVSQADVDVGEVENCADVTAIAPDQGTITAGECITDVVAPNPVPTPDETPDPTTTPTPAPTAPPTQPATPDVPETPDAEETPTQVVSKLPETGSGGINTVTPILWIAALLGVASLFAGAAGTRKRM